jgi:hypothetical protein
MSTLKSLASYRGLTGKLQQMPGYSQYYCQQPRRWNFKHRCQIRQRRHLAGAVDKSQQSGSGNGFFSLSLLFIRLTPFCSRPKPLVVYIRDAVPLLSESWLQGLGQEASLAFVPAHLCGVKDEF